MFKLTYIDSLYLFDQKNFKINNKTLSLKCYNHPIFRCLPKGFGKSCWKWRRILGMFPGSNAQIGCSLPTCSTCQKGSITKNWGDFQPQSSNPTSIEPISFHPKTTRTFTTTTKNARESTENPTNTGHGSRSERNGWHSTNLSTWVSNFFLSIT